MSIKTMLVHLNDERRAEKVLLAATAIARRHNAHLIGLDVSPGVPDMPPLGVPYAGEVMGYVVAAEKRSSARLAAIFDRMTSGQPFVAEWRAIEAPHADLAAIVTGHARSADLIVAAQADPAWELSPVLDFPERLALSAGRPVLMIPYAGTFASVGRTVLVAWNGSREAARAVFDSLPLLVAADKVIVLGLNEPKRAASPEPDLSVTATLVRHGVKAIAMQSVAGEKDIGEAILSRLAETGADLLVMGAWGHSRLHEMVFGGVTRHLARHMTTPTLMSH
jgi:nucleotide-binding universal stress UspA family protein